MTISELVTLLDIHLQELKQTENKWLPPGCRQGSAFSGKLTRYQKPQWGHNKRCVMRFYISSSKPTVTASDVLLLLRGWGRQINGMDTPHTEYTGTRQIWMQRKMVSVNWRLGQWLGEYCWKLMEAKDG